MNRFWRRGAAGMAVGLLLAGPGLVMAQEEALPPNTGAIGITGGADWTSAYFFRGFLQEKHGSIVQPWAQLNAQLLENDDFTLDGYVGIWNSLHSRHTFAGALRPPVDPDHLVTNRAWYEFDFYTGVDLGIGDFTIGVIYTLYTSPSHAFGSLDELGLILSYDDSALWGDRNFALNPYVAFYHETRGGNASTLELGIGPAFEVDLGQTPLTLEVPVVVGLDVSDYYDDTLGYVQVGLQGTIPLPMPARYGDWALTAGVAWLHLASDELRDINRGDRNEIIGTVGVGFSY